MLGAVLGDRSVASDFIDTVTGGLDDIHDRLQAAHHGALQVLLYVDHEFTLVLEPWLDRLIRVRIQVL